MKTITLPYPPPLNNLYATVRGRRVLSEEGRSFKARAGLLALAEGLRPTSAEVEVAVAIHRPRKAGDLDNFLKVILDSMTGVAWHDDKQVRKITAERFEDKENPRAVISIQEV